MVALGGGALALNHQLVGVFYDDGLYAGIAYALSHGLGYVHPHLPGHPAVVHYPPLFPLVLAPRTFMERFQGCDQEQAAQKIPRICQRDQIHANAGSDVPKVSPARS